MQIILKNPADNSKINKIANHYQNILLATSALCIALLFYFNKIKTETTDVTGVETTQNNPESEKPPVLNGTPGPVGGGNTLDVTDVVTDAMTFYNMLSSAQQTTLQLTYSTSLARKWSNLPCGTTCRNGLQLGTNLTTAQYTAAMQIIKDILSTTTNEGYDEFHQMNMAEAYLHANGGGTGYDSTLRWIAFLNTPSTTGAWMLQFGGHHYAANIAFNNGHVIGATPFFMGLEPKTFTYNTVAYDPLGGEKTAFAAILSSLSTSQLSTAYLSSSFSDCVMIPGETNNGTSVFPAYATGQALSSLTTAQQQLVLDAIKLYVGDMEESTYDAVIAGYTSELSQTYVSYHDNGTSGSASSFFTDAGDYIRISGPNVWIEFSCQGGVVIQNQIHYHTVWRDRSHDYGVDLTGDPIDVTSTTGITATATEGNLKVYPNPTTNALNISLPYASENATILISDLTGRKVWSAENYNGKDIQINTSNLSRGNYLIRITDKAHSYSAKITKQ